MHLPISIWRLLILLLALAPLGYYLAGILAAFRFFARARAKQLPDFTPPVSVLKPVHGIDFASYENFGSFCRQDYPDYEILFCVNELSDPAVAIIEKVIADFPERSIRILFGAAPIGSNRKINNLVLLARGARHEILLQSDGDVRVGPNYLHEVVAPFRDPAVGVVSCLYRGIAQNNLWAQLEAVGAASDFIAGALVAGWKEGVTFALGASVATTKSWLVKIGGYESLANLLADDYEIGNRVYKVGGRVLLSREPVWTMYPAQTARGFWEHQVRWARTIRLVRPASFLGLLLTHGLPLALLAAAVAPAAWIGAVYLLGYLVLRLAMAWVVGVWGLQDAVLRRKLWLVPLRDLLHFAVWLAAFASHRIKWGGLEFELRDGQMIETQPPTKS
ncbi:MAG TPA: bacteriohopanetetrol glucosamine biosynthesis glycosyltransferase HpnI [Verrucomicrobiae bacterium]|nr:bacteriohopanetetrol glucosamine biosynthesis glycosyltransferase HpnI [Verrucomicrobiae bacterium]